MFDESIELQLIRLSLGEIIARNLRELQIDISEIANTTAINVVREIQQVLKSEKDDFDMIDDIVNIFKNTNCPQAAVTIFKKQIGVLH